jgi:hypothetical protein
VSDIAILLFFLSKKLSLEIDHPAHILECLGNSKGNPELCLQSSSAKQQKAPEDWGRREAP